MLLTAIPYFKEVIVMSFQCEHCGATNNDVQSASAVRGKINSRQSLVWGAHSQYFSRPRGDVHTKSP